MAALRSSVKKVRRRHTSSSPSRSPSSSSSDGGEEGQRVSPISVAAFLFRRDFRAADNVAFLSLYKAATQVSLPILPLFFFNPSQCDPEKNSYFGRASFQFLCQSLVDLNEKQLGGRLVCLRGADMECFHQIEKEKISIQMLGYNADFTPFARERDRQLRAHCLSKSVEVYSTGEDYSLLGGFDAVMTGVHGERPYSVFTPFYRRVLGELGSGKAQVAPVQPAPAMAELKKTIWAEGPSRLGVLGKGKHCCRVPAVDPREMFTPMPAVTDVGGREVGLTLLQQVSKYKRYGEERDDIAGDRTTHWSPHLKFGTISIRECWKAVAQGLGASHDLARQLIWREFYAMLLYHHPRLVAGQFSRATSTAGLTPTPTKKEKNSKAKKKKEAEDEEGSSPPQSMRKLEEPSTSINEPFQEKYLDFRWEWKEEHFTAFKEGRTGIPLVDASVRCLTTTGWCPNRCRMVIANYLVKTLGVDWREGERWYATVAVDYDVANNNGGWLWSSGQGADAQPFFRTFNPFRQSERFDKNAEFIRRWVPELAKVPPSVIHHWEEHCQNSPSSSARINRTDVGGGKRKQLGKEGTPLEGSTVEDIVKAYPAPIVCTKTSTQKVIDSFKSFNASLRSATT